MPSDSLVFYTNPMSRGRIVRWMLEEVGQPYRTEILDYGTTMKSPEYLAINPMGKVPASRHGDTVVTEGAAICTYLADAFPQGRARAGTGDRLRGPYYRWMFFAAGPVEAAVSNKALGLRCRRSARAWSATARSITSSMRSKARSRKGDYIVGDRFTAADLYLGSHIGWGMQFGTIEKRPAFERYWQRLGSRPAAVRAKRDRRQARGGENATDARISRARAGDRALDGLNRGCGLGRRTRPSGRGRGGRSIRRVIRTSIVAAGAPAPPGQPAAGSVGSSGKKTRFANALARVCRA